MSTGRFIIEGEWSGYRSGPQRIVHRTVHKAAFKLLRAWAENTHAIRYSDGTRLILTVRECRPREKVQIINGYAQLIEDCFFYGVDSVEALLKEKERRRAAKLA